MDGTKEKELADQYNVGGWPHLLMFRKVKPFKKYMMLLFAGSLVLKKGEIELSTFDYLKGQCHEIFCFRFFLMNHLPPSL